MRNFKLGFLYCCFLVLPGNVKCALSSVQCTRLQTYQADQVSTKHCLKHLPMYITTRISLCTELGTFIREAGVCR